MRPVAEGGAPEASHYRLYTARILYDITRLLNL